MSLNRVQYFVFNICSLIIGGIIIYISLYLGLKNYYGITYVVPTGVLLFTSGVFLILVSLFLFVYYQYWDVIKELLYQRLILKYKIFWVFIIGFIVILCFSFYFVSDFFKIIRSIPVFPMLIFDLFSYHGEIWINIYSIVLRYTIGLWITVIIWYFLIKKLLNRDSLHPNQESMQKTTQTENEIEGNRTIRSPSTSNKQLIAPPSVIKRFFLNKYLIIFIFAFLLRFIIYFNAYPGYDTGFYLALVKEAVQTNDFSIFFGNSLSVIHQNLALMSFPTSVPLIGFTYLTGGDPLLAASIYIPILSVIVIYLTCKILKKATNSKIIPLLTGFFLAFSVVQLTLISGLYKQLTTICVTLLIIYFLFFIDWQFTVKTLAVFMIMCFLFFIDVFYFLTILIFLLISVSYLLIKRNLNWSILKNIRLFFCLKIFIIAGIIVIAGGATYLYYEGTFPFIDLSIFYNMLSDFTIPQNSGLWLALYNDIYLFAPFLIILIFSLYGFISDHKKNHFINKNLQLFLKISFITLLILVLSDLFNLSFSILDDRFLIFFEFTMLIYASIGIVEIYSYIKLNFSSKIYFKKSKRIFICIFVICVVLGPLLSIPYFRFGKLAPTEKEAMLWLLNNGKTDKLINDVSSDVVVVSNHHLEYWVMYLIHHNAINGRMYWKIGMILDVPVNQFINTANETIYFLVSKIRAPSGESWADSDVLNYIIDINTTLNKNYFLIYNNSIVYIYAVDI